MFHWVCMRITRVYFEQKEPLRTTAIVSVVLSSAVLLNMAVAALTAARSEAEPAGLYLLFGFVSVTKLLLAWLFDRMAIIYSLPALVAIGYIQTDVDFGTIVSLGLLGVALPVCFFSLFRKIGLYSTPEQRSSWRLLPLALIPSTALLAGIGTIAAPWAEFDTVGTVFLLCLTDAAALMGSLLFALLIVRIYEKLV